MDLLEGLNPAQVQAVQAVEGPVLVLAGPGSGKTRVLTHRIAFLIRVCGVRPYRILAVTFTNKAAQEMSARLASLIGESTRDLTIGTFHAICARILRREGTHLGMSGSFVIYDEDDQDRLVTRALKELNLDTKLYRPSSVRSAISRAKNELITAQTYRPPTYWHEAVARVFERYEQVKAENNALDFDDLLVKVEELFRVHDEVRQRYQRRYEFVLVDEFQDTNKAQYELVAHLSAGRNNVFVVGDEDQSIYSWRGADFRNVLRFRKDFPQARVCLLEQNYRSTGSILGAAQAIIAHNTQRTEKRLWTANHPGAHIVLTEAYDEHEESGYVVSEILRLSAAGEYRLGDMAVMYRTNAQSRALEDAFVAKGVHYRLVGGTRYYQRREIKDVLSYLRLVYNPNDQVALIRVLNVPPRGIGEKTVSELGDWASGRGTSMGTALLSLADAPQDEPPPLAARSLKLLSGFAELLSGLRAARATETLSGLLTRVLEKTGYLQFLRDGSEEGEDRAANVRELFSVTAKYDELAPDDALANLLEETALISDADELTQAQDSVTLLTLHTAKGLEYDVVFIVGMEEGICPHSRSFDDPNAMEEERRLCYVGVTRAKHRLYLVRTFRRTLFGSAEHREPSRFLQDIPSELTEGNRVQSALTRQAQYAEALSSTMSKAPMAASRRLVMTDDAPRRAVTERLRQPAVQLAPPRAPWGDSPSLPREPAPRPSRQPSAASFRAGEVVTHALFGKGTVIESKNVGDDEEVTVAFEGRGVKRLMASFAKLQKG